MAAEAGSTAKLVTACVPDAMAALRDGDAETHNRLVAGAVDQLGDVDVLLLAQFSTAQARPAVAAKSLRARVALLALQRTPPADAGRADAKTIRRRPVVRARANRSKHTLPKIKGKSFRHVCRPPYPADSMNQKSKPLGIPYDSIR